MVDAKALEEVLRAVQILLQGSKGEVKLFEFGGIQFLLLWLGSPQREHSHDGHGSEFDQFSYLKPFDC